MTLFESSEPAKDSSPLSFPSLRLRKDDFVGRSIEPHVDADVHDGSQAQDGKLRQEVGVDLEARCAIVVN